jgi:UDPglucose 6-dehydrogenase
MINYKIAVVGNWHLAFTSAACLSSVGHKVLLMNVDGNKAAPVGEFPKPPVAEPGLPEMIQACHSAARLDYSESPQGWTAESIWLAIDTPVSDKDEPDVAPLVNTLTEVFKTHSEVRTLIVSSQIPVGFGRELQERFKRPVVYVPENLRLGKGIETFLRADRTVIGADAESERHYVKDLLKDFQTEFLLCGLETSEMTKHATNIFLAMSISFANELARIGERYGVESQIVAKALKMDKRIGPAAYVAPGLGFAGGTLPRDLRVMQKVGREKSIPTPLIDAILTVNQETTTAIAEIVLDKTRALKRPAEVLILGYTYKADIDTLRRSLSIDIAKTLKAEGCHIWGFDPIMNDRDLTELDGLLHHCSSLEKCEIKPDVVLVMTARPLFKNMDWTVIVAKDEKSTLFLDTQNMFSKEQVLGYGFDFKPLWSPEVKKSQV